jgi:large subunit ribosomal protein L21
MYAIIKTGGKQYPVDLGDRLFIEKLDVEPGAQVEFDKVLYLRTDDFVKVGTPYLDAVRVIGTAVENGKAKKVVTFKYKAKKDYRKKQGHRQPYTLVEIDSITVDGEVIGRKIEIEEALTEQEPPAEASGAEERPEAETTTELVADGDAEKPAEKPTAKRTAKPKADKAGAGDAEKPAAKRTTSKTEADSAEKPAVKRAAKPKAEKVDADGTEKPAVKRTAKPKAEKAEADAAEKPVAKRAAKPKLEDEATDAAPAAPEEEKQ